LIAMFTFFIVFVKINGRPFGYFLKNLLVYIFNPKTRIWNKGQSDVRVEIYQPKNQKKADPYAGKRYSRADIERVARAVDRKPV
ncbi:MAG: hypothetical protein NTW79_02120, partial [Candidatus Berkelbacteria bacterium]|nr:hypothetical protein [Candidatus Berkelbacteria bacterium]